VDPVGDTVRETDTVEDTVRETDTEGETVRETDTVKDHREGVRHSGRDREGDSVRHLRRCHAAAHRRPVQRRLLLPVSLLHARSVLCRRRPR
jgi:hypothetical protein